MSSPKKVKANQENGRKGKDPITARGKGIVAKNALKEGLFAPELYISEEDRPRYKELYDGLHSQLNPKTPMQQLAFETIPCCAWRHVLALRREKRQFTESFAANGNSIAAPPEQPIQTEWYATDSHALRGAINFLQLAKGQLDESGYIHEKLKQELEKAFGADFITEIEQWRTSDLESLKLAHMTRCKAELFGWEDPAKTELDPQVNIVVDPTERVHMQSKIMEMKMIHLRELRHIITAHEEQGARASSRKTAEPPHRYVSSTLKELLRATDYYRDITAHGL